MTFATNSSTSNHSMFDWIGYNKKEILFNRDPAQRERLNGIIKLFDLAIEGITSFTTFPSST
jgi:polyisoprenyl-phosphate glycosyltransferase